MVVIAAVYVDVGRGRRRPPRTWHGSFAVNTPLLPGLSSYFHFLSVVHHTSGYQWSGTAEVGTGDERLYVVSHVI